MCKLWSKCPYDIAICPYVHGETMSTRTIFPWPTWPPWNFYDLLPETQHCQAFVERAAPRLNVAWSDWRAKAVGGQLLVVSERLDDLWMLRSLTCKKNRNICDMYGTSMIIERNDLEVFSIFRYPYIPAMLVFLTPSRIISCKSSIRVPLKVYESFPHRFSPVSPLFTSSP